MNDALSSNGKTPSSNVGHSRSNRDGAATSHTVALIRMGEDGKITYGGDKAWIRELVSKLVAIHDA
jgi:hypothetical protein